MMLNRNAAHLFRCILFVFPAVVFFVMAGTASHAAEAPAQRAEDSFEIGQVYADPLLESSESLHEALGFATGFEPALRITMNKSTYVSGDVVQATEFTLKNPNTFAVEVEVKVWITIPGQSPVSLMNLGTDGSLSFPANFNSALGPLTFFSVNASIPKGTWGLSSRVLNPTTGELYSEDINTFIVK